MLYVLHGIITTEYVPVNATNQNINIYSKMSNTFVIGNDNKQAQIMVLK